MAQQSALGSGRGMFKPSPGIRGSRSLFACRAAGKVAKHGSVPVMILFRVPHQRSYHCKNFCSKAWGGFQHCFCHLFVIFWSFALVVFFAIGIIIFLSFWIWLTLALSFWCRLFVILVSFLCHFGGARREGGRGRAPTEICTFPEAFSFFVILESFFGHFGVVFFCHFGVILLPSWNHFLSFWWGAEGGRKDGAGHQTEICTFPEPLSFFCHFGVIFVSFWWGAEGGRVGQGTRPKFAHFPRHCDFFWCHFLSFGGVRNEGGQGRVDSPDLL